MATNPYVNKVVYDGSTLIDLSSDTLSSADQLAQGIVAHDRTGATVTGTADTNSFIVTLTDNPDWDGESDDFLLKDKTFAEIRAAYIAGKTISVKYYEMAVCWYDDYDNIFRVTVGNYNDWPNGQGYYEFGSSASTEWEFTGYWPFSDVFTIAIGWDNQSNKWVLQYTDYNALKSAVDLGGYLIAQISFGTYPDAVVDGKWDFDNEVYAYTIRQNDNGLIKEYSYTFGEGDVTTLTDYHEYSTPPSAGTEGTPVATKGTVSNHSVSVTPSVTNVGGVIQGGTHTGIAVTVSASELVSGTYTVDSAGTKDVTNYASASIASGTEGTPSATKGTVSNHSVTVTPSVTNTSGWITGGTKTGTAVTVSASELATGNVNISQAGQTDVTNYATATVPTASYYTGLDGRGFYTDGGQRKWHIRARTDLDVGEGDTEGWLGEGSQYSNYYEATAVPANTTVTPTASSQTIGGANYVMEGPVTVAGVPLQNKTVTENGTVTADAGYYGLGSVVVNVQGGGGSGPQMGEAYQSSSTSSSVTFTGLNGEPTSFFIFIDGGDYSLTSTSTVESILFDGTSLHGQTVVSGTNAVVYDDSSFSKSYSNGTLTITSSGPIFNTSQYYQMEYSYGGSSANIDTKDVQVGSGATSITFTGLDDEPIYWSCIFKSNFGTSSGYQRVIWVGKGGHIDTYGHSMDSAVRESTSYWTSSYSNGSLTITSQGTNAGGYFHQPGYYQLTAVYGDIEPQEIDVVPLSVTENGTYTAPSGTAYSPVTVSVSGGSLNVGTKTLTNTAVAQSLSFTSLSGQPKYWFLRVTSQVSSSGSTTYYYVTDLFWDGTSIKGNTFRIGSTRRIYDITSGISQSYSNGTLTITAGSSSGATPGQFYGASGIGYELVYIY